MEFTFSNGLIIGIRGVDKFDMTSDLVQPRGFHVSVHRNDGLNKEELYSTDGSLDPNEMVELLNELKDGIIPERNNFYLTDAGKAHLAILRQARDDYALRTSGDKV